MPRKLLETGDNGLGWSLMDIVINALTAFFIIFMIYLLIPKADLVDKLINRGQSNLKIKLLENLEDTTAYKLDIDGHRQTITLGSNVLFPTLGYSLQDSGRHILTAISNVLKIYQNKIYDPEAQAGYFSTVSIDGHTDSVRFLTRHHGFMTSNWHLSSMRAISVLEFFETQGVDAKRMSAAGFSSTRPVSTDTISLNRRVEITLIYSPEKIREAVLSHIADSKKNVDYKFDEQNIPFKTVNGGFVHPLIPHSPMIVLRGVF